METATTTTTTTTRETGSGSGSGYRTYQIRSWYEYQRFAPSHLHSILHYNKTCEEYATPSNSHVMVLREDVTKITGYYWCTGWSPQNCAESDGYVDVRTGKKYTLDGPGSFFKDIQYK